MYNQPSFQIIKFREVNFENQDLNYFDGIGIPNAKNIFLELSFELEKVNSNTIEIFTHVSFDYEYIAGDDKEKKKHSFFHGDFVAQFDVSKITDFYTIQKNKTGVLLEPFAQMLGTAISMTRGYMVAKTQGTFTGNYNIPMINPMNIIARHNGRIEELYLYSNKIIG